MCTEYSRSLDSIPDFGLFYFHPDMNILVMQFLLYFSGHGFASSKGSPHVVGTDANAQGAQAVNLKKDFVVPLDKCCDGAAIVLLVDACMVAPEAFADDRERTTRLNGVLFFLDQQYSS